jgi:hypothetical protein
MELKKIKFRTLGKTQGMRHPIHPAALPLHHPPRLTLPVGRRRDIRNLNLPGGSAHDQPVRDDSPLFAKE